MSEADFIDVDFFIFYLFKHVFELGFKRDKEKVIKLAIKIEEASETIPTETIFPILLKIKEINNHSEAEFILLKLGQVLGYDTYSPDRNKEAYGQKLEDLISFNEIPQFTTPSLLDTIKKIDVIWFEDEFPVYCFEIEHTTGVTAGLVRLANVSQLNTKLFVIAPRRSLRKIYYRNEEINF